MSLRNLSASYNLCQYFVRNRLPKPSYFAKRLKNSRTTNFLQALKITQVIIIIIIIIIIITIIIIVIIIIAIIMITPLIIIIVRYNIINI